MGQFRWSHESKKWVYDEVKMSGRYFFIFSIFLETFKHESKKEGLSEDIFDYTFDDIFFFLYVDDGGGLAGPHFFLRRAGKRIKSFYAMLKKNADDSSLSLKFRSLCGAGMKCALMLLEQLSLRSDKIRSHQILYHRTF